jgi:hypothetical protein
MLFADDVGALGRHEAELREVERRVSLEAGEEQRRDVALADSLVAL